jgi:exopolysaccharide biosynthesis WecB/TagA/CpsF family protein
MRLTDVISSYKDLLPEPATAYAEIIRLNPPDFHPSVEGFDLAGALANPAHAPLLHAMDTVRIFSRFDFENPPTVSVLGDVRLPGTYQTSGQIHLADAIHMAGGLTPDAQTTDAQVFRYLPDGKFKIFSVALAPALGGDPTENILLEPRDRLLIHRNPDAVEPATVYLQGEVGKPGRYPLTTNMRVADLIRIGGGLKPGADAQAADLTKYDYSDQSKLSGKHAVITLSAALAGDVNSNAALHNGDVLTIRQLPGWNDLGASMSVKGEVKHPGSYGIRPGERLSSILERAGGFGPNAYPYGAVLQRVQVRELESRSQQEVIVRVKDAQNSLELLPDTDPKQKQAKLLAVEQSQSTLEHAAPDIFWVGISTPKQEKFMAEYLHKLNTKLMLGVGAAFDFHTGRVKLAPKWMKEAGLAWFFRLCHEPRRLWRRYLFNNPSFIWAITLQLLGWRDYALDFHPAKAHEPVRQDVRAGISDISRP